MSQRVFISLDTDTGTCEVIPIEGQGEQKPLATFKSTALFGGQSAYVQALAYCEENGLSAI